MSRSGRWRDALMRSVFPVYRKVETRLHPLRYLFVEITQRCNLSCLHCGSDCGVDPQLKELRTEDWLGFFRYLKEHFDTSRLILAVTGGEPICHPEWGRILKGFKENGLVWGMVSNGWALTGKQLQACLEHGMQSVTISVDGLPDQHDWLRGRSGSYDRAIRALRLLKEYPPIFYDAVTCVHPGNLEQLPALAKNLEEIGLPSWRFFSIFPRGRAKDDLRLALDAKGFRQMLDFISAYREKGGPIDLYFSCEGYLPKEIDAAVRPQPYFCRAGISIASVLADGGISACPNTPRTLVQGNILVDDFKQVWEERFIPHRDRRWMRTGPCAKCSEWAKCQGNSLHLWDEVEGRVAVCSYDLASG